MCFNLVLGPSDIYSLRQIFLTERVLGSRALSWLLHINTLTAIYAPHMSVHSSQGGAHMVHFCPGILTYCKVHRNVISRLSSSNHTAFFRMLRTPVFAITSRHTNWWTVLILGGAVTATQRGIGLTETSEMIMSRKFGQDGPHAVRYCSGTCFFFSLRQNCRYQSSSPIYAPASCIAYLKKKLSSISHYYVKVLLFVQVKML